VEWAEDPVRSFEVALQVTVTDGKGVLARVASTLASAGADITHVNMSEERAGHATDLRFAIAIQDKAHLNDVLRALERTPSVLRAERSRHSKERTRT
jgi:guanosine-3',5'-bis(diphosphate) 3'-pyrophosphohydrolase